MVEFTVFKGSEEGKIVKGRTVRELGYNDVLIRVTHSGLCGTDEHYKHCDMVLGHEGTGVVEDTGASVKKIRKGDVVGWGYQTNSCGYCKQCLTGHETLCPERQMYGYANNDQGSFASHAIWNEDFIYKIPSRIKPEHAAPLMCGGATVFNVLHSFAVKPAHRVGVIGVGGLGHLAIQFAAKMGCQVIVFSQTDSKKAEALSLGATEFVTTKGESSLDISAPIDHLIVTTSQLPDWKLFLPIMASGGAIYPLSVSSDDFKIPYMPILANELKIQGSLVAARQVHREMLEFAGKHGIKPIVETFPMTVEGIEESMARLSEGKMRYRGVLVAQ